MADSTAIKALLDKRGFTDFRWIDPKDIDKFETVPMLKETLARVYKG